MKRIFFVIYLTTLTAACSESEPSPDILESPTVEKLVPETGKLSQLASETLSLSDQVSSRRSDYQLQTAQEVARWTAYMDTNRTIYGFGGAGMAAQIADEEHLKKIRTAGLQAELDVEKKYVELAESARAVVSDSQRSEIAVQSLQSKLDQFRKFLQDKRSVQFPKRSEIEPAVHRENASAIIHTDIEHGAAENDSASDNTVSVTDEVGDE